MNFKKSLANVLMKSTNTIVSRNAASALGYGLEDMPKSLKSTR